VNRVSVAEPKHGVLHVDGQVNCATRAYLLGILIVIVAPRATENDRFYGGPCL
jgi:hypothetical protein